MTHQSQSRPAARTGEATPFWTALEDGYLCVQQCRACTSTVFYPRVSCPHCHSNELEWIRHDGTGRVYSFTVVHRRDAEPYSVALVEIAESARLLARVSPGDRAEITIGCQVVLDIADFDGQPWFVASMSPPDSDGVAASAGGGR